MTDGEQLALDGLEPDEATAAEVEPQLRPLTDRDRAIIEFERIGWGYAGRKETEIRERFDLSGTKYAQLVSWLLDHSEAEAYDPTTIRRLRRLRDLRSGVRRGRVRAEDVPTSGSRTHVPQTGIRPRYEFR